MKDHKVALVTGGAGFIGSHLTCRLLENHWRVIVFDNLNSHLYSADLKKKNIERLQQRFHDQVELFVGDFTHSQDVESLFSNHSFEIIFHFGALAGVRPSLAEPFKYIDVNVGGTLQLLEAARRRNIKKFVFGSSSSIYGNRSKMPFSESDNTDFPFSPYGASKKSAEIYCSLYRALFAFRVAILRFFTVYGPGQRPDLAIHRFVRAIRRGQPITMFGDGTSQRDYTYIDDLVDGILGATSWLERETQPCAEIFNLGNSKPVSLQTLVTTLEKVMGKKAKIDAQPRQPGDVENTYADISKAAATLGYRPHVPLEEGLTKFVTWYDETMVSS